MADGYGSDYGYSSSTPDTGPDFEKDPDETTDYTFDWAGKLDGDTILTSAFTLLDGMTSVSEYNTTTSAVIFVSGGSTGSSYRITNRITTVGGRVWEKTARIAMRDL